MKNLRVSKKLALGFGVLILFVVVTCFYAIVRLQGQQNKSDQIIDEVYPKAAAAQAISYASVDIARLVRNLILNKDDKALVTNKQAIDKRRAENAELISKIESATTTDEERALLKAIKESWEAYIAYTDGVVKLALANSNEEATSVLYGKGYQSQGAYLAALKNMVNYQERMMAEAKAVSHEVFRNTLALMIGLGTLATLIGIAFSYLITRSIVRPLNEAVAVAQTVAAGDLTSQIVVTSQDETGQLLQALKEMNLSLVKIVGDVRSGTEMIASASGQIASGNADLSSRTEQQASSLEETASSMEELTSTVKQNADNARQANQLAVSASDVAIKGGEVVSQVVHTMGSIHESARKIVDIIAVIDGIAFQTNILALNAAVEAARAGEQGRGFAVVASEVRTLAQRSAAAAKEIKGLIGDSVEKVDAGSKLVAAAGTTMEEIVDSVKRVTDIMAEIMAASHEQSAGIEQVNQAIGQMDQVTQQNAALVEEAAAAAESMQEQAGTLAQVVAVFTLANAPSGRRHAPVPAAGARVKPAVAMRAAKPARTAIQAGRSGIRPVPTVKAAVSQVSAGDEWEQF